MAMNPNCGPLGALGVGPIPGRYGGYYPRWAIVLNIAANPSCDEIKRAYHAMAALNHPDHGGTHESMIEINKAYDEAMASIGNS